MSTIHATTTATRTQVTTTPRETAETETDRITTRGSTGGDDAAAVSTTSDNSCLTTNPSLDTSAAATSTSTPSSNAATPTTNPSPSLLHLPLDALHAIASYVTIKEWYVFSRVNKMAQGISTDVVRRVKIHGYKCATEIITAFYLNEYEDTKELITLYLLAGVSIYPKCFGYTYPTLLWRMQIEMQQRSTSSNGNASNVSTTTTSTNSSTPTGDGMIDPFHQFRLTSPNVGGGTPIAGGGAIAGMDGFRNTRQQLYNNGSTPTSSLLHTDITYLEEKMMFYNQQYKILSSSMIGVGSTPQQRHTTISTWTRSNNNNNHHHHNGDNNNIGSPDSDKVIVPTRIHEHLVHQHYLKHPSINDNNGNIETPPISLSADFYHPSYDTIRSLMNQNDDLLSSSSRQCHGMTTKKQNRIHTATTTPQPTTTTRGTSFGDAVGIVTTDDISMVDEIMAPHRRHDDHHHGILGQEGEEHQQQQHHHHQPQVDQYPRPMLFESESGGNDVGFNIMEEPLEEVDMEDPLSTPVGFGSPTMSDNRFNSSSLVSRSHRLGLPVVNASTIDIYSSSTTLLSTRHGHGVGVDYDTATNKNTILKHIQIKFVWYQRRLEAMLSRDDYNGFEECMLDFWDEFFPSTKGFHYYDRHTCVPRISSMHEFLTKPCPKAVGIIQCEIERIKTNSRGKGVSMKGRLFPTYEYRLYIRNRQQCIEMTIATTNTNEEDEQQSQHTPSPNVVRRDTVLMVAKNHGKKIVGVSKKGGSNNYYLYMPQQEDLDEHFNKVNGIEGEPITNIPNGPSNNPVQPDKSSLAMLLGRLQSNFIGTEFQIFIPRESKIKGLSSSMVKMKAVTPFPLTPIALSDDEYDSHDSACSKDNNSTLHRSSSSSIFPKLLLRRNQSASATETNESSKRGRSLPSGQPMKRTKSSSDVLSGHGGVNGRNHHGRSNRRAIANTPDESDHYEEQVFFSEVEDGVITYTANLLGSRPRIMDVCIPKVSNITGEVGTEWRRYLENCEDSDEAKMLSCFRQLLQRIETHDGGGGNHEDHDHPEREPIRQVAGQGVTAMMNGSTTTNIAPQSVGPPPPPNANTTPDDFGLLALQNRPPWWNIELGSFVLNFGGRVSVASVKNFQLCERNNHDRIMLQFGRVQGRHSFTMDFQHPLTAVQAFAISVSSLQSKMSFG